MPTVGILAATLLFAPSAAALGAFEAVPTLSSYVEACRKAGITIPQTLSCSDGEQVKIFKTICPDGKLSKTIEITEENFSDFAKDGKLACDNPTHLDLQGGQCFPGSRIQRSGQCVLFCRRNALAPAGKKTSYNDINMICHNEKTGGTCFFNSVPDPVTKKFDGWTEGEKLRAPGSRGETRWAGVDTVKEIGCIHCHDKSPFNVTPHVKATGIVPHFQNGPYYAVGGSDFFDGSWNKPFYQLTSPEAKNCTSCHRIGTGASCGFLGQEATAYRGQTGNGPAVRPASFNDAACPGLTSRWMAPHDAGLAEEEIQSTMRFIEKCCNEVQRIAIQPGKPTALGCVWAAIPEKSHLATADGATPHGEPPAHAPGAPDAASRKKRTN